MHDRNQHGKTAICAFYWGGVNGELNKGYTFLNITIMLGNGAELVADPNLSLPRINRISDFPYIKSWNHRVSVLAGRSITQLCRLAFSTHFPISLPYGGLHQHIPVPQFWDSPSCSLVKYISHFAFSLVAHTSMEKLNSPFNSSKVCCGVAHKSVSLVNIPLFFMSMTAS